LTNLQEESESNSSSWTGSDTDYQPSHNGSSSSTEEGDKGSSCAKSSADGESTEISNDKDQQLGTSTVKKHKNPKTYAKTKG
ncbi:hypothetical protein KUCAC02_032134, partial [Chaenocephalus aceratus]